MRGHLACHARTGGVSCADAWRRNSCPGREIGSGPTRARAPPTYPEVRGGASLRSLRPFGARSGRLPLSERTPRSPALMTGEAHSEGQVTSMARPSTLWGMARHTLRDALERLPAGDQATLRRLQVELALDIAAPIETAMSRAADAPDVTAVYLLAALCHTCGLPAEIPAGGAARDPDRGAGASAPATLGGSLRAAGVQAMWSARRCGLCRAVTRQESRQTRCDPCEAAWLGHAPAADWGWLTEHDPALVAGIATGQSRIAFLSDLRNLLPETRDPGPLLRVVASLLADPRGEKVPSSVLATRLAGHVWRRTSGVAADPPVFFNEAEWWAQA